MHKLVPIYNRPIKTGPPIESLVTHFTRRATTSPTSSIIASDLHLAFREEENFKRGMGGMGVQFVPSPSPILKQDGSLTINTTL